MKLVIQCAGSKSLAAATLKTRRGKPVHIVAHAELAPHPQGAVYARPDDLSDVPGQTWRMQVEFQNEPSQRQRSVLLEAYRLYRNSVYGELVARFGVANVFILSAGWGLVRADYRLPAYDITFSPAAQPSTRRTITDEYQDFCHISTGSKEPVVLLASREYLPLFARLTDALPVHKLVFHASGQPPTHEGWETRRFQTTQRTNWQYACAKALLSGSIRV